MLRRRPYFQVVMIAPSVGRLLPELFVPFCPNSAGLPNSNPHVPHAVKNPRNTSTKIMFLLQKLKSERPVQEEFNSGCKIEQRLFRGMGSPRCNGILEPAVFPAPFRPFFPSALFAAYRLLSRKSGLNKALRHGRATATSI